MIKSGSDRPWFGRVVFLPSGSRLSDVALYGRAVEIRLATIKEAHDIYSKNPFLVHLTGKLLKVKDSLNI